MFFDEPRANQNQIMLSAKADLAKVQQLIDKGQWTQAENQLAEVSSTVQSMNDSAGRKELLDEIDLLNAKVDSRDPNATLPPAAPPPSSAVLPAPQSQISSIPSSATPSSPAAGRHRPHSSVEPSSTP